MATKQEIRDSGYNRLGWIETDGDKQRLYSSGGMFLGAYVISEDKTYNSGYVFVGYGNLLMTLLK